jgi:DNA-binding MarR family transcriptional regulator
VSPPEMRTTARTDKMPPSGAPPPPSVAFLLISLGSSVREGVDTALRPLGLSLRHVSALGHLSHEPGLSYSELGRRAGVTPQSMQATLNQLQHLHAVERRTSIGRGRTAQLHITQVGTKLLAQGQAAIRRADQRLLTDIPAEQHEPLLAALLAAFLAAHDRHAGPNTPPRSGDANP